MKINGLYKFSEHFSILECAIRRGSMFDAKDFNLPKEEVCN